MIITGELPAGARRPAACPPRRVRMSGVLGRVRSSRPGGPPMLRAELSAATEPVTIVWLGRTAIAGIEPGRTLAVEGKLSVQRGRKVIYNPRYELAPGGPPSVTAREQPG